MIVAGTIITLAIFLFVGWAVSAEMFQHRAWRRRVESGDVDIVGALIEEALGAWRRARPPKAIDPGVWSGVQAAQLVAVSTETATVSTSAEGEFRSEGGQRVQVRSALDEAMSISARLLDMLLYDVPNLRMHRVRIDVYSTFPGADGTLVQQPILTVTANRAEADELSWEALTPVELMTRFGAAYEAGPGGQPRPITLPPLEGQPPRPASEAAADFAREQARGAH